MSSVRHSHRTDQKHDPAALAPQPPALIGPSRATRSETCERRHERDIREMREKRRRGKRKPSTIDHRRSLFPYCHREHSLHPTTSSRDLPSSSLSSPQKTTITLWKPSRLVVGLCAWALKHTPSHTSAAAAAAMITMNHHPQNGQHFSHPPHPPHPQQAQPQPVYNGVNQHYPGLRIIHASPPVFCVDEFLTYEECNFLMQAPGDAFTPAPVVGKGTGEISASRTSSTCYLAREDVPSLMRKVSALTGKPIEHCELPQVGRYFQSQQYVQHYDAFNLDQEDGLRFAANGGQRTVTVLVYLNDVAQGGATSFPNLNLQIQPKQGMALVFFPATLDGLLDRRALHAAMPAVDTKFVSQIWIRQGSYFGQASKRLLQPMGVPLAPQEMKTPCGTMVSSSPFSHHHEDGGVQPMSP